MRAPARAVIGVCEPSKHTAWDPPVLNDTCAGLNGQAGSERAQRHGDMNCLRRRPRRVRLASRPRVFPEPNSTRTAKLTFGAIKGRRSASVGGVAVCRSAGLAAPAERCVLDFGQGAGAEGGVNAGIGRLAVAGGALQGHSAAALDQRLHGFRRQFLAVAGARGAGDGFVHQGAAQVVGASLEGDSDARRSHLYPGSLDIGDFRVQGQPGHRVDQHGLAIVRSLEPRAIVAV